MARKTTPAKPQPLAAALLAACTTKPRAVKDVVADALWATGWSKTAEGGWSHPTLTGKTPAATASATLLHLVRAGKLVKPERGMVKIAPKKRGS